MPALVDYFEKPAFCISTFAQHSVDYFGIDEGKLSYTRSIDLFIGGAVMSSKELYDYGSVILKLRELFPKLNVEYTDIYISKEPINSTDVSNLYGQRVFPDLNEQGWFVFVDPINIANWSHPCEYWFFINDEMIYSDSEQEWPPQNIHELIQINLN